MADPGGGHDAQDRDQGGAVPAVELDDGGEGECEGGVFEEVGVDAAGEEDGVYVRVRGGRRRGLGLAGEGGAGLLVVADEDVVGHAGADDGEGEDRV